MFLVALSPIALLAGLILIVKLPLWKATLLGLIYTLLLMLIVWVPSQASLESALTNTLSVSVDIISILIGALLIINYFISSGGSQKVSQGLSSLSTNKLHQTILVSWFLSAIIEGVAGFGTPGVLVVPILMAIGLKAFAAIKIALIGNTIPVVFGAVGLPLSRGIGSGLASESLATIHLDTIGITTILLITSIAWIVPIAITRIAAKDLGLNIGRKDFVFAAASGFVLTAAMLATSFTIGYGFASVVAGILGLVVMTLVSKSIHSNQKNSNDNIHSSVTNLALTLLPTLVVIALILLSRILGVQSTPGLYLIFVGAIVNAYLLFKNGRKSLLAFPYKKLLTASVAIVCVVGISQLLILSPDSGRNLESVTSYLAGGISAFPELTIVLSPLFGAIGSAITGSATVSNLLLSESQFYAAELVGLSVTIILSLQLVGAALGNAISITNIANLEAVSGASESPTRIIKANSALIILLVGILVITTLIATTQLML